MRNILIFLAVLLAAVLQASVMPQLALANVTPSLVLAGVLAWAIWPQEQKPIWIFLVPALLLDLVVGRPFGLLTLNLMLVFFGVDWLASSFFKQSNWPAIFSLTLIGVLFFELGNWLLSWIFAALGLAASLKFSAFYFYATWPTSLILNGFLCLVVWWLFNQIRFIKSNGPITKFK